VLAAFATVAAVIVSLRLARRAETVRLRVILGVGLTPQAPSRQYVTLHIDNIGVRAASLPLQFFEWRVPFRRRHQPEMMINIVNSAYLINPQPDINLASVSNIMITTLDDFSRHFSAALPQIAFKLKWFRKVRLKRIGAVIYTNGNRCVRVKFSRIIADQIHELVRAYLRQ
jgi:hypothetical protein